jgi:hypothetical protein
MTTSTISRTSSTTPTASRSTTSDAKKPARNDAYWATGHVPSGTMSGLMMKGQVQGGAQSSSSSSAVGPNVTFVPPPVFPGSDLITTYGGDLRQLADDCKIRGGKDIRHFQDAMGMLTSVSSTVSMASPGQQPTEGQLKLTAEQIAAIQNAPTPEAAKAEVLKAIAQQTGVPLDALDPTHRGRKGNRAAREALNALLGTKVKDGREKNAGSAMILDAICDSVAKSVRATSVPVTPGRPRGDGVRDPDVPGEVMIDLASYKEPAKEVGEMASPLIFDLAGTGLKIKQGELLEVDIDGDGKKEVITDLDRGIGLLVFDSKSGEPGAGRDHFGDKSDLSAFGVFSSKKDRTWDNGFDALRALCEHFEIVRDGKQFLDARDLAFLEKQVGLRMRIDGLEGADRTFAEVRVTRIHLGDPKKIQSMRDAQADGFGNKLMKQEGATFVVSGAIREYADIWFNVVARAKASPPAPAKLSLMSQMSRRI